MTTTRTTQTTHTESRNSECRYCQRYNRACGRTHTLDTAASWVGDWRGLAADATTYRVISERWGLVWTGTNPDKAERIALAAAINTARTVYLQDGEES